MKKNSYNLSDEQLLLLDNLIYLKYFADKENEGKKVKKLINNLLNRGKLDEERDPDGVGKIDEFPASISKERWIEILKAVEKDQQLCSLRLNQPVDESRMVMVNGKEYDAGGLRVTTFVDTKTNFATVVFRGTKGAVEWHDNGQTGFLWNMKREEI